MKNISSEKSALKQEFKKTKKSLQAMSKTGSAHRLRTKKRVVKYGAIGFARNIWLSIAATMVMTITLIILFTTIIASAILASTADAMREKIDITIYFRPGTSTTMLESMAETLQTNNNVKSTEISTSKDEYQKFLNENADDETLMETLNDPSMRDLMLQTMQSTIRIKVHDTSNLTSIENLVATDSNILTNIDANKLPTYDVNRAEIDTVTSWANIARNAGIILSIIFFAISILVIFNTIRMAIFSRREEIYMMRLVGADNSFIRSPFIIEAQICGVISGIIASTAGYIGFHFITPNLENYGIDVSRVTNILESQWIIMVYTIIILVGIIIGTISANLAIHKYLVTKKRKK